jgi:hypothetical protein
VSLKFNRATVTGFSATQTSRQDLSSTKEILVLDHLEKIVTTSTNKQLGVPTALLEDTDQDQEVLEGLKFQM